MVKYEKKYKKLCLISIFWGGGWQQKWWCFRFFNKVAGPLLLVFFFFFLVISINISLNILTSYLSYLNFYFFNFFSCFKLAVVLVVIISGAAKRAHFLCRTQAKKKISPLRFQLFLLLHFFKLSVDEFSFFLILCFIFILI